MDITLLKNKVSKAEGRRDLIRENKKDSEIKVNLFTKKLEIIDRVQSLLQVTAQETQEKLRYHIEDVVQSALDACFPDKYNFRAIFELKRGRTEARLVLESEGEEGDPMDENGGGVIDTISLALRLAVWCLSKTDNVLILDEPLKFLSVDLRPLACRIIQELSSRLKLQLIIVTHDSEIINIADKVFEIDQDKKGVSFVKNS